jgi:AcrR family transcriptional regulator
MSSVQDSHYRQRQILVAVRKLLAQNGYAATTISQIAAAAGVSRGLLHYYFKSKEALLAHAVRENVAVSAQLAEILFEESETVEDLVVGITDGLRHMLEKNPEFFHLFFESWAIARQSDTISRELGALYTQFKNAIHRGLEHATQRGVITPVMPLDRLASVLTSIIDGMGLQLMAKPASISDDSIWQAMQDGLRTVLGKSG